MTRKHYEAMARAIRNERWRIASAMMPSEEARETTVRLALTFANACAGDNPRFDLVRFLEACGIETDEVARIEAKDKAKREAVLASLRDATN